VAHIRFIHLGNPGPGAKLAAGLILAAVIALLIAIGVLAVGLFLIVTPFLFLAGLAYYVFRTLVPRAPPRGPHNPDIIEGEFRVIDPNAARIPEPGRRES
jgi:hypothetical protein